MTITVRNYTMYGTSVSHKSLGEVRRHCAFLNGTDPYRNLGPLRLSWFVMYVDKRISGHLSSIRDDTIRIGPNGVVKW